MNPQVILFGQRQHRGLRGSTRTDLDGRTIVNESYKHSADIIGGLELGGCGDRKQRLFVFYDYVHIIDMNEASAQNPGHAGIHLGNVAITNNSNPVCINCKINNT